MCYYQTPFNIALILEPVSNYNNVLRDQVNMEKSAYRIQNNIIRSKMRETAKEHVSNGLNDGNLKNESKDMK